ncbi:MAG: hypothetical protein BRD43_07410 [Bacteroidetes bacterium QS_4_64_154]|nr:MAG: hypothetical protein BRD43_07410 [Bacteroidetes bacterium QS_4_64_154]
MAATAGCDTSVQAFDPSTQRHYSVFGVVNPAQDTQWVRVEPLPEPTSSGARREIDATVTLENLSTGQEWTLRDSLMEVFRDEFQHNFWTTAPITPGTSYRLVVSNTDGDSTWATTTTPSVPPSIDVLEEILLPCREPAAANVFEVRIETEELAALQVRYFQTFLGVSQIFDFDSYDDATRTEGAYMARDCLCRGTRLAGMGPFQRRDDLAGRAPGLLYERGGRTWHVRRGLLRYGRGRG